MIYKALKSQKESGRKSWLWYKTIH